MFELGIKHVWMHCMMGTKPGLWLAQCVTHRLWRCAANGITVIPGACPNQFLKPDVGHKMMRGLWRMFGFMNVN
jgi:hypothetical protein